MSLQYRAKHDIVNTLSAGCFTGGVLSAKGIMDLIKYDFIHFNIGGPKAALVGCAGFAAFSAIIEQFMKEK